MLNETGLGLSVVAAQLVEAACCARAGNTEAAKIHIAHAVARLDGRHSPPVMISRVTEGDQPQIRRGGLALWQARRVAARVDANLAERVSTPELAKALNLSVSHFSRAFKCTFGVSPHAWVLRRRMEVAQGLMLTTSAPLSEIAVICGMADQAHFTHCFPASFWRNAVRLASKPTRYTGRAGRDGHVQYINTSSRRGSAGEFIQPRPRLRRRTPSYGSKRISWWCVLDSNPLPGSAISPERCGPGPSSAIARRYFFSLGVSRSKRTRKKLSSSAATAVMDALAITAASIGDCVAANHTWLPHPAAQLRKTGTDQHNRQPSLLRAVHRGD
jgi:AraC family transcriptional regulator